MICKAIRLAGIVIAGELAICLVVAAFAIMVNGGIGPQDDVGWNPVASVVVGDDNYDGLIDEDESGWRCWSMGNRHCSTLPLSHR